MIIEKPKVLILFYEGCARDIAWKITIEGYEVKYYCASKDDRDVGDGFFPIVDNWKAELPCS